MSHGRLYRRSHRARQQKSVSRLRHAQAALGVHTRIQETDQTFRDLDQVSKSIAMHFGDAAAKPFFDLPSVYDRVSAAELALHHTKAAEGMYPTPRQKEQWEERKRLLSCQGSGDPVTAHIDEIRVAIKDRFGKYLRPNLWRLFLPHWD
jgi:hypothetical protein